MKRRWFKAVWVLAGATALEQGCIGSSFQPGDLSNPGRDSSPQNHNEDTGCDSPLTWYADADGDFWGDSSQTASACEAPEGMVAQGGDCDDTDPAVWPGATERCDGLDSDCDGDSSDAGRVTWTSSEGQLEDLTQSFSSGSASSPKSLTLRDPGVLSVCPGTWYVSLTLQLTQIELRGLGGQDAVILSGGGVSTPLILSDAEVSVSGLTLSEGYGSFGGGLVCQGGRATLSTMNIQDNTASSDGGGFFATEGCALTATDLTLRDNSSKNNGGAGLLNSASMNVQDLTLEDNIADNAAGGLYALDSVLVVEDCTVRNNRSRSGGGMVINVGAAQLSDCALEDNIASADGGALYVRGSQLTLSDTKLLRNEAANAGGGLLLFNGTEATLERCEVSSQVGRLGGGAYVSPDTTLSSIDTHWISNSPEDVFHDVSWSFDDGVSFFCSLGICR